jgi:ComF family protein
LPLTEYSFNEENAVDRIFYGRTDVKKAASFLFYKENSIVQNLIHHLKYRNQQQIGAFLGEWYGQILAEDPCLKSVDTVIPVPLHPRKERKRGYNQVSLFAQKLAVHLQTQYDDRVLIKTANTKTQTSKGRISRWRQKSELYVLGNPTEMTGKHILLVDDVITTGATIEACAEALHRAPNLNISVASMAVVL